MNHESDSGNSQMEGGHANKNHYGKLGIMAGLSFLAMYFLMYAMVNVPGNVFMNVNQVYMAGLMAAPMVLIELVLMSAMYQNKRMSAVIGAITVLVAVAFFLFIRQQAAIGDRQFLRSMIPHHASAILMCQQASISDARIRQLCNAPEGIVSSQQREIEQMKTMLQAGK